MVAGFEIRPATPEEAPTLALINRIAFNDVATWNLLMTDVDPDDVTKLFLAIAAKRMADGNVTYVSTVDKETGYADAFPCIRSLQWLTEGISTILGATAVYVPIKEKDTALNPEMPAGVNEKLAAHVFGEILQETRKYGYDPEKHCRKRCSQNDRFECWTNVCFRSRRSLYPSRISAERARFCIIPRMRCNCR